MRGVDCSAGLARRTLLLSALAPFTQLIPAPARALSNGGSSYNLANGAVTVPPRPWTCGATTLVGEPSLVGSGSSSAVFGMMTDGNMPVAVKISWPGGASASVENERKVLEALNENGVKGVCRLRGSCTLPGSTRVVLVLDPLVPPPVVDRVESLSLPLQLTAAEGLGASLAQILAARVATTDVQMLIDGASGVPLLIDFSEARLLGSQADGRMSELDLALASSFVSEVDALVPSEGVLRSRFLQSVAATLRSAKVSLPADLEDVLTGQLGL
jgi:hypothetical protein